MSSTVVASPQHSNTRFSLHVLTSNHLFHDDDEDIHVDDGSVKDIEDHNQDGAHDITDADNDNNEAEADPHLTVEDSCLNASGAEAGGCRGAMR